MWNSRWDEQKIPELNVEDFQLFISYWLCKYMLR